MDAEVIEIVDNSQQDSVDEDNVNNPTKIQTKEETRKRRICPLFIPKGKNQGKSDEKDSTKQVAKNNTKKRENTKRLKKASKPIDIVDCVNDSNQVANPIQSQKRPKEKDIMSTPDMFLTKTEREEKKRRLQVKRESEVSIVSKTEEPPKHQKVYSIFQKTSIRKQQLIEQADTSFRDVITWNHSHFPKHHFFLPQSNHFQLSSSEQSIPLQYASSTPIEVTAYFQGDLPVLSQHIEDIIDVEDFSQELFPPIKQYLASPKVQTILNTFSSNDPDRKLHAVTYLQNLYPVAIQNRGSLWIDCCREGGKEMIWEMNELSQDLISWLSSFKGINFDNDDDEDDWISLEDCRSNNSYIIAGYEGKTSLVYHLANTLDYKVIEVNNADQAIANIVNSLQEATQSRVIKGQSFPLKKRSSASKKQEREAFTKCPVILIDDLDVNVPSSQSFSLSAEGISIGDLTSMDLYTRYTEKSSQLKQGYIKSIKQLIQGSKCPVIITSSYLTVDIENLSPQILFIPQQDPSSVVLHTAVITLAFTPSIPPELIFDVCLQSRYDCRKSVNSLQFISSFPSITPSRCYSSLLYWPYERNKEKQMVLSSTSFDGWDDDNLDYFMYSNYLSFFAKNHPARSYTPVSIPTITLNAVSPAIVPQEGGLVIIKGKEFSKVNEVFLIGSMEGSLSISFEKTESQLHVHIPALPRGLYSFLFFTKDGRQLVNSGHQPWFGSSSILVSPLLHQTTVNSEDEFEENHSTKWKKGKTPVVLLSDLFTEQELLFEEEGEKKVKEGTLKELEMPSKEESKAESNTLLNEVRIEKELEIANELTLLADSYDVLICETQLQHPSCSFCDCRDDENCVNGIYYHPEFYWRQKKMALDMTNTLYQLTLHCDTTFMKMPSLATREKEIMLSYYQQKKWGGIVEFLVKVPSLSYLLLKRTYMDYLYSVLTIQHIARCDRDAKDFSRRGQQVYPNVERMLYTADRSLCSQFVEFFCKWADYDSLCSEEEVNMFWKGL